jgi:GNAT superfamily N-acetyltransferase
LPLSPPEPLRDDHRTDDFTCGEASLDIWLKRRARANQASGASRTYVVCDSDRVIGYYALASGAMVMESATGKFKRNMPNPIPVAIFARLAVDQAWQGRGIGRALFRDAAARILNAAETIGIRGIVVHAISEDARSFYLSFGFDPSPREPMILMITLTDLRAAVA